MRVHGIPSSIISHELENLLRVNKLNPLLISIWWPATIKKRVNCCQYGTVSDDIIERKKKSVLLL